MRLTESCIFLSKKDLVAILSLALLIKAVKYLKTMIRKGFASGLSTILMKKLSQENGFTTLTSISEEENSLFEVLRSLNLLERRLIYLKFHEEKTDWEIAKTLGVSRQAVTKAKKKLLKK